jgi:toxin ParE1/3/4
MAEYRLAPKAEDDLDAIWRYSFEQWGVEQADVYVDVLTAAFAQLAEAPMIAPACEQIRKGYRKWPVERHVVYFRRTTYGIAVIRILHDRMDAPLHF